MADIYDMGKRRRERARLRAERRGARGETLMLRDGDLAIAELAAEFPLDVLEPLTSVNLDIALLIDEAMTMSAAQDQATQVASLDTISKILAANPDLFKDLIGAIKEMTSRLLGEEGYVAFIGTRPSPWDVVDMAKGLLSWYGVSLGESSPPSESSNGGAISQPTSSTTTDSTPLESGETQETQAS